MRAFFVSDVMARRAPFVLARVRLVLAVAGVAWLLGYSPGLAGRLVAVAGALVVLALDYVAGTAASQKAGGTP
jgi:hypothetical protein